MAFPQTRLRRLRSTEALRRLVGETRLSVQSLMALSDDILAGLTLPYLGDNPLHGSVGLS